MPTSSAPSTSRRLLTLLSLLQTSRDWPGDLLADRLAVSSRTVRRDVDRLRELGYPIHATKGPDGGYRLQAGAQLPPLLFDDEQAVAVAIALRGAALLGAGIEEPAERALATLRQVMPSRLRHRLDALEATVVSPPRLLAGDMPLDSSVLLTIGAAIRSHQELRFNYHAPADTDADAVLRPPRRVQPHHLVARVGRWYLIAWDPSRQDWRIYRADRMQPRIPTGPRFTPREIPGGDPARFLAARFKGSPEPDQWPCRGQVLIDLPASEVATFAGDGVVEPLGPRTCRLHMGSWSWAGLAATLARFNADIAVINPPELRAAFKDLARRATKAAETTHTGAADTN